MDLDRVVKEYPQFEGVPEAIYGLGELAITTRNYSRAIRYFEDVISRFPESEYARHSQSGLRFCKRESMR